MYEPTPIDTSSAHLPAELENLIEQLAEHNHDLWARQRIADGWTYGPRRDDAAKQHPDLVPYGELPEGEKEYDRQTAVGVIKAILTLGYRIERPTP